jgi:hypothetical protein
MPHCRPHLNFYMIYVLPVVLIRQHLCHDVYNLYNLYILKICVTLWPHFQ